MRQSLGFQPSSSSPKTQVGKLQGCLWLKPQAAGLSWLKPQAAGLSLPCCNTWGR